MNRVFKNASIFIMILLLVLVAYSCSSPLNSTPSALDYNQFMTRVENGEVAKVTVVAEESRYVLSGTLTDGTNFTATVPPDPDLLNTLREMNIPTSYDKAEGSPWWANLLATLLPMLLLIGFFMLMMQQSQGGGGKVMQFGKSRARLANDEKQKVTFKDVAGVDEAKEELAEVVDFLKSPGKFTKMGAKIPKGILLYGPPGTGKTLLAKAIAGEAGVPFFTISGSDFVEMFVGVGASRVRDLFEQAKKHAPCIIFIDEIDAVGRQRGAGLGGGHDEREQTLNQLLVEMDGFGVNEGIIVIAGTNRPDVLDPALLRPGRFDRHIAVDVPDVLGRRDILKVHIKGKPLAKDVDLDVLARRTPGFTGADLANMLNEGALLAARRGKTIIEMDDLEDAIERVIAGPEKKSRMVNEKEKKIVAYHEAGHAVLSYYLPNADPVHKVSIIPRGRAGGYTLLLPEEDKNFVTKSMMEDDIVMLLGGRMAELLVLKDVSNGAQNDLERATHIVREMITRYGMSEELGPLTFGKQPEQVFLGRDISQERNYSEAIAYSIDKEARRMINEAYERARTILETHMDKLVEVAEVLMVKETIDKDEFYRIMRGDTEAELQNTEGNSQNENGKIEQDKTENAVEQEVLSDPKPAPPTGEQNFVGGIQTPEKR